MPAPTTNAISEVDVDSLGKYYCCHNFGMCNAKKHPLNNGLSRRFCSVNETTESTRVG